MHFNQIKNELELLGLKTFSSGPDLLLVLKPLEIKGNGIFGMIQEPLKNPFNDNEPGIKTDAPLLGIFGNKNGYRVQVWQWTPGPGPGDFELTVSSDKEAIELARNYFFEENVYFEAYRKWKLMNM
jgi:hypothetical protein